MYRYMVHMEHVLMTVTSDIPVCGGVGWWRGVESMAGSEVEGVPGGSVMVMQERPGDTRNNVLPTHLLQSQIFKNRVHVLQVWSHCGNLQITINGQLQSLHKFQLGQTAPSAWNVLELRFWGLPTIWKLNPLQSPTHTLTPSSIKTYRTG